MRQPREHRLVRPGCHGHTSLQHGCEERRIAPRCHRGARRGVVGDGLVGQKQSDERADHRHGGGQSRCAQRRLQRAGEACRPPAQRLVVGGTYRIEHGAARCGGHRTPRQRARLVHRARRGQHVEDVFSAAEGADGEPAADDLSEAPQIRRHAERRRCAAGGQAEPGDHLVEDEQRAHGVAGGTQALEKAGGRRHHTHVGGDRFHDHARHRVVELGDDVVGDDDGVGHGRRRYPRRARKPEGGDAAATPGQEGVGMAVVAAVELHHPVAPRVPTSDAHRAHGCFGTRRHKANARTPGNSCAHGLGQEHFGLARGAVGGAPRGRLGDGVGHNRVGMSEEHGAVGLHHVDVARALDVPQIRAASARHGVGRPPHRREGAHR